MIPLNFGLWWSGCGLSYLRYLTFKSLRHFHPDSKIQLFIGEDFNNEGYKWNVEKQDFEDADSIKDYLPKLKDLDIEVINVDWFSQYPSNYQSDLFRWFYLNAYGGFYLDTDQIILKSFKSLPLDNDLLYTGYKAKSCGYYTPVGVIGAVKDIEITRVMKELIPKHLDLNNYNSAGPFLFREVLKYKEWKGKMLNLPSHYFYPAAESFMVEKIFNGNLEIPRDSYCLHWFAGHSKSQEFNKKYTEEFAKTGNDIISRKLSELGSV